MADVFDNIPLEKHTGQGKMTVAELRAKYGPGLTFTAVDRLKRITRGWERSQVQVLTIHFVDANGNAVVGLEGRYFWPNGPEEGFPVKSDYKGDLDWAFSAPSFYDPPSEVGPYTFKTEGLTISGMGSPSKNHAYNHDSMSWDVLVNPTGPTPEPPDTEPEPPDPEPGQRFYLTTVEANLLRFHASAIDNLVREIVNRPPEA